MAVRPAWFPDWTGLTAAVIGSGPSASAEQAAACRSRVPVIAVNESWRLAPWCNVLYACDFEWWQVHRGVPEFMGLKVSGTRAVASRWRDVRWVQIQRDAAMYARRFVFVPGTIGGGGNSGFQAANLAIAFGARRVLLLGFDMRVDAGLHWHGPHPQPLRNARGKYVARWREILDSQAGALRAAGIEVVNCSPDSALQAFPKMSVVDALSLPWSAPAPQPA